jgi:hypothetical protein
MPDEDSFAEAPEEEMEMDMEMNPDFDMAEFEKMQGE